MTSTETLARRQSASVGVFGGHGQKVNTVPGNASFSIDRRLLPNERITTVEQELRKSIGVAAGAVDGMKVVLKTLLRIEPASSTTNTSCPQHSRAHSRLSAAPASFRVDDRFHRPPLLCCRRFARHRLRR